MYPPAGFLSDFKLPVAQTFFPTFQVGVVRFQCSPSSSFLPSFLPSSFSSSLSSSRSEKNRAEKNRSERTEQKRTGQKEQSRKEQIRKNRAEKEQIRKNRAEKNRSDEKDQAQPAIPASWTPSIPRGPTSYIPTSWTPSIHRGPTRYTCQLVSQYRRNTQDHFYFFGDQDSRISDFKLPVAQTFFPHLSGWGC